jgi:hypothetical protein
MQELNSDFTDLLLRFLVADRLMLQAVGGLVDPSDFEDRSERIVANLAITHWRETQEPISSFLRIAIKDYLDNRHRPMQVEAEANLKSLVNSILKRERPLIAATKVTKMFQKFKTDQFMRRSMDEVLELQMQGELNVGKFAQIAHKCAEFDTSTEFVSRDFTSELNQRIMRRAAAQNQKYPLFFIDEFDERGIRNLARKELGLFLAPYKSGKSMALSYMTVAHARQKDNVLHISFEDTEDILERRLDAQIADLPINQIIELSGELRERFEGAVRRFRGRIRLVDAVGKTLSMQQVDAIWERERASGFIADTVVLDYDDKIAPPTIHKGDNKRREIDETYNEMLNFAGRRQVRLWSAAQVGRRGDGKKIIDGSMVAEDIRKVQKATIVIGIGVGDQGGKHKHLFLAAHRDADNRFGIDIMTNYRHGLFYDRDETLRAFKREKATSRVELL